MFDLLENIVLMILEFGLGKMEIVCLFAKNVEEKG